MPVHLLLSPHHSDLDIALWALIDVLGSRERTGVAGAPVTMRCKRMAARLDVSLAGISKSLGRLTRPHTSDKMTVPDAPAWVTSRARGAKRSGLRWAVHGVPYVEVPEASLGSDEAGPLVSHGAWRLYALYLHKRHAAYGTVKLSGAELGQLLGVRPATITKRRNELVAAGLVAVAERAGHAPVVSPVVAVTAAGLDDAVRTLTVACGQTVDRSVDSRLWTLKTLDGTCALADMSPPAPEGMSGSAPAGMSIGDPPYQDPNDKTPPRARAFAPPAHAHAANQAPPPPARDSDGRLLTVTPLGILPEWCGRCSDSRKRLAWDDTTGRILDAPCPACNPGRPRVWLGNALGYAYDAPRWAS
ncbi:hypothetical protein [Dactylosporangium sp. CS-033363]|uniref:hypothetical protein n=1 Tax=Dactylosporangium sp. CS-033363 TaxID=3239935 RepID=UPI003D905978